MRSNDMLTGTYLFFGIVVAVVGSFLFTLALPLPMESVDVTNQSQSCEVARRLRVREQGVGGKDILAIGKISSRIVAWVSEHKCLQDLMMEDVRVVLPKDSSVEQTVEQTVERSTQKKQERSDGRQLQSGVSALLQFLPSPACCRVKGLEVERLNAASNAVPWFTAAEAEATPRGIITLYDCIEISDGRTNRYPMATLEYKPSFRLVPSATQGVAR